jgi:tRNA (Thr-GGU) A37 N-methylase
LYILLQKKFPDTGLFPIRPNPIGMSVLEVLKVNDSKIYVKGIDMLDGTPVLDIKPYIESKFDCASYQEK